jgi:hypothetical protein
MLKLPVVYSYAMDHYVCLSLTNRKSSVHLRALYSPPLPRYSKDVHTPQVSTRDLWTVLWSTESTIHRRQHLTVTIAAGNPSVKQDPGHVLPTNTWGDACES